LREYELAAARLGKLAPQELPRFRTAATAAILERLVDPAPLRRLQDGALPHDVRFAELRGILRHVSDIAQCYRESHDAPVSEESTRLLAYLLRTGAVLADLSQEWLQALGATAPSYPRTC
jgi:hypothetical protein